jgi:hypothetical protein
MYRKGVRGFRKLGRLLVWAVAGGQFIDLIWRGDSAREAVERRSIVVEGTRRLSQGELAALMARTAPERPAPERPASPSGVLR